MNQKTNLSTKIYFICSCVVLGICFSILILPRFMMFISNKTVYASVDKLYKDDDYDYVQYTYKNEFNNQIYSVKKALDHNQYSLLEGKKVINIQYSEYLTKYTIIEILGDSDFGIGIFLLATLLLIYKWASS